jgi:diguanylate cyclase
MLSRAFDGEPHGAISGAVPNMNFAFTAFTFDATTAPLLFGLAVAVALLWCGAFMALQVAQRTGGSDRVAHRNWLVSGTVAGGVGLWAATLCGVAAAAGRSAAALPSSLGLLMLLAALAIAGASLLATLEGRHMHTALGVFGTAAALFCLEVSLARALGLPTPPLLLAWLAIATLLAQAALLLPLARWHRDLRHATLWRTALMAAVPTSAGALPFAVLAQASPIDAAATPASAGIELLFALLAMLMIGLALNIVVLERRLVGKHQRLSHRLRRASANLERTPYSDPLTKLPNRSGIEVLLRTAAMRAEMQGARVALLFIGLDAFKHVSDTYAQGFGDRMLRDVARRLVQQAEGLPAPPQIVTQTLARVGTDEFVLMLEGRTDRAALSRVANRVLEALNGPLDCERRELTVVASIGVACFPEDGGATTLLLRAETAMQAAKEAGGSNYMYFESRMQDDARERMELLRDLRRAVEDKQLELFFQPKIDARSGQVSAAEALLRWHHPTRGTVSPEVFIPIAERYGLMSTIGNWVIEDACRQARAWREAGLKMRVAINLSVFQMRQDDLVDRIQAALKHYGINPSRLTCEITESVAMEDTQVTQRTFERLGEAGIHLSIDDFGTGYSSLAYLRKLPASELKIDRSFVKDLDTSPDARAIVDAVLKLAHAIGLNVVAEGVETERQRDLLLELGCDELQGFLFARPMSARALLIWAIEENPARHSFRASLFAETRTSTADGNRSSSPPPIDRLSLH